MARGFRSRARTSNRLTTPGVLRGLVHPTAAVALTCSCDGELRVG